jgi:hypothetical protein
MKLRILTISAASALVLGVSLPAHAQANAWGGNNSAYAGDDSQWGYRGAPREAYDNGYQEGLKHGSDAARKGKPFDLEREGDYRSADEGYHRDYGDKDAYRGEFRRGFAQGYREAYDRYYGNRGGYDYGVRRDRDRDRDGDRDDRGWRSGGYGNGGYANDGYGYGGYGYGQASGVAFQNGARDGYQKGTDDARDGKYPDVTRHKWYKNATRDYNDRYGPKELYQRDYRRGFEEGYRRAFNQGGYYRR